MTTTLRVSESTRAHAAALAARTGTSIGDLVERALDAYETAEFWRQTRDALTSHDGALDPDPAWEMSVRDGLDHG
jgi:hypothetical protein